tara:strand:+ start:385 stop:1092 length:708 start_codon:yes stop_codon:yes gene_type:complete
MAKKSTNQTNQTGGRKKVVVTLEDGTEEVTYEESSAPEPSVDPDVLEAADNTTGEKFQEQLAEQKDKKAADDFEKEFIFSQLNQYYIDDEGLFYDGLRLIASTDLEAAQEYIQPGDLGVWYFFTGEPSAPTESYFLSGVETLTFKNTKNDSNIDIQYSTDESNKLDARFGSDKQPADVIASSIKELAGQILTSDMYKTNLNPTIKVRNFKSDQLSIFTSNTISETETTSTTTSAY